MLSAVTFLILARSLSVEEFGGIAASYGLALFLSILLEFGAATLAIRELAGSGEASTFVATHRARQVYSLILVAVCFGLGSVLSPHALLPVGLGCMSALARVNQAPLQASLQFWQLTLVVVSEKAIVLTGIVLARILGILSMEYFFWVALLASLIASQASTLMYSPSLRAAVRLHTTWSLRALFRGSKHLGFSSVASGLQSLDTLAIKLGAGAATAGIYGAVGRWTQPMGLIAQAVTQSGYGEMVNRDTDKEAARVLATTLVVVSIAALPLAGIALFASDLVGLLLGPPYAASAPVLRLLALAMIVGMINLPVSRFLQARRRERLTSVVLMIVVPTEICLMAALAHWRGATAAALAVVFAQGSITLVFGYKTVTLLRRNG